ncbi:MAG: Gfo/Idh/MocA family protein [Pirellulales bacterium]
MPLCRFGILGAAGIARKNWQAMQLAENCTLAAVASRSPERAGQFIADCQASAPFAQFPRVAANYEELLASPDIDAVYIPLPTGLRKPWVLRAAQAGKHVLVEKPVGVTAADVQEMLDVCRQQKVQFMDGVMFMHSARLGRLRAVLDDGQSVGKIRRIASHFTFGSPEGFMESNIRVSHELEPLGSLGDLGWYNIRFTLWALNYQLPTRVSGRILAGARRPDSSHDVPVEFSAELQFPGEATASLFCSFLAENQQWGVISGTRGFVQVPDFVLPYYGSEAAFTVWNNTYDVRGCNFNMQEHARRHAAAEYSNSGLNSQETNMFREFARLALSGQTDESWGQIALKTQQVVDACLASAQQDGRPVAL